MKIRAYLTMFLHFLSFRLLITPCQQVLIAIRQITTLKIVLCKKPPLVHAASEV